MDTRIVNKVVMFLAVNRFCLEEESKPVIASLPSLANEFAQFGVILGRIRRRFTVILGLNPKGITEGKDQLRENLATEAARISGGAVAWATASGMTDLASKAHLTKTMILVGREIEAADRVDHLLDEVAPHLDKLQDYGVTSAKVNLVRNLNAAFSDLIGRPIAVIDARKRANRSVPHLMKLADDSLAQLDRLVNVVGGDHPEFAEGFRSNRKIRQVSASRALSEVEQANAEARAAKKALSQAKQDAQTAAIRAETSATIAQAEALSSGRANDTKAVPPASPAHSEPGATFPG